MSHRRVRDRRDKDGFDVAAVVEAEEKLPRGVGAALRLGMGECGETEGSGKLFPQRSGKVRHVREGSGFLFPSPFEDLLRAEGGFALLGEP
jgi:hypothetical protein